MLKANGRGGPAVNGQTAVRAIQKALGPWVKGLIDSATRNCVRRKTVTVATAPNGATMGVREPFDTAVMDVPYVHHGRRPGGRHRNH